jgi:hypothetical protein
VRTRRLSAELLEDVGISSEPHPLVAHFARVNNIGIENACRLVDDAMDVCDAGGQRASIRAVIDALGQAAAIHHAGNELRAMRNESSPIGTGIKNRRG